MTRDRYNKIRRNPDGVRSVAGYGAANCLPWYNSSVNQLPLDPWYVTGLIDGEGCFSISRTNTGFVHQFRMNLRNDDRNVLELLVSFLGCGKISQRSNCKNPMSNRTCEFWINKRDYCLRLCAHLDKYPLRAKKQNDYAVWREFVMLPRGLDDDETKAKLKQRLSEVRKYR